MERSDIPLQHDKTIIEIAKDKKAFKPNKPGTVNYSVEDEELYLTVKSKGPRTQRPQQDKHDSFYQGKYNQILAKDERNNLKGDINIHGNLTVRDNLNILKEIYNKEITNLSIGHPLIEVNMNEKDKKNSLIRAGMNINRGLKGSANVLYDESLDAFNFCLDPNTLNESFSHTDIEKDIFELTHMEDNRKFKLPIKENKDDAYIFFLNSIKVLQDTDYKIEDDYVIVNENLNKYTSMSMIRLKLRQFDKLGKEIKTDKATLKKTTRKIYTNKGMNRISLNQYDKNSSLYDGFEFDKSKDILFVFVNGTFLGQNLYSIVEETHNSYIELHTDLNPGTEVYIVSVSAKVKKRRNRVILKQNFNSFTVKKEGKSYKMPVEIEDDDKLIVFINSVLLDTDKYKISKGKIELINARLTEDSVIEIVKFKALTTSPELDSISYLMEKDDLKILATIDKNSKIKSKKMQARELDITEKGHIQNLLVSQQAGSPYGLKVQGDQYVKEKLDVDGLASFNDYVNFNEKVYTNKKVKHNDWVIHGKNYLYLNDLLEKDNGGIIFERAKTPHAIIKWNERIERWMAGIEGSEQVIITKDMLYTIIEKLIDLSGVDEDIHTSIKIDQSKPIITRSKVKNVNLNFEETLNEECIKESQEPSLLLFVNGRYISEDEYEQNGNNISFKGYVSKDSIIYASKIKVRQESLTGYPIKETDLVRIEKNTFSINAEREGQIHYHLPFDIDNFKNANLVFINGILLTPDLYEVNGKLLTLSFRPTMPTELTIVNFNTIKGASLSRVELISKPIKMSLEKHDKDIVKYKLPSRVKKESDYLVFCNTTFLHKDDYYFEDGYLILRGNEWDGKKTVTNPPTEISMVEFIPVIKSKGSSCSCNSNNSINHRSFNVKLKSKQQYVALPFSVNDTNSSLMVFLDGKLLNRSDYEAVGNILKIHKLIDKEVSLYVTDFVGVDNKPEDFTGKGSQVYEFIIKNEKIKMPFTVKQEDTNLVFIDGRLIDKDLYYIEKDSISFKDDKDKGKLCKLINFSNLKEIEYGKQSIKEKIFNHNSPSKVWRIMHNMNSYPNVIIIDDENVVIKEVKTKYISANEIELTFNSKKTGRVILK